MKFALHTRVAASSSTNALALSPDGSLVAVTTFDQKCRLYRTDTMALLKSLHLGTAFPHALCFSPDGRAVASGGKALTLFDTTTWKKGVSLKGHRHELQDAAFSPDGSRVYTGSGNNYTPADWSLRAWDAATGDPLWKWKAATPVFAVAVSPDRKTVAAGDRNGTLTLLDAETGLARGAVATGGWIYHAAFVPDGSAVVASGDAHHLSVVSTADASLRTIPMPSGARAFALTPDGTTALVGGTAYGLPVELLALDLASGEVQGRGPTVGRLPQGVACSPDGLRLYVLVNDPHELLVFDL